MSEHLNVAIIGSGPSGYYAAETLLKSETLVHVDMLDRLPTPYGLIRGGVAPDHQSIKGVSKRFEKTSIHENFRFIGHLNVGTDISLEKLQSMYDAVVIATGAPLDRNLGIRGEDKNGVVGSASLVGWYNSHPDFAALNPDLDIESVVVIGNGNVAIDVARVLAKTADEMAASDLASHAAQLIHKARLKNIWLVGRRGPMEGKFTQKELGEMGELENCVTVAKLEQIPDEIGDVGEKEIPAKTKNLNHLKSFTTKTAGEKSMTLHVEFYARPIEILGDANVEAVRFERTTVEDGQCIGTGEEFDIPCQMVVPCIGYASEPMAGAAFNEKGGKFENAEGVISDNLYVVGWAKRGPSGTIGTNRLDAIAVMERVIEKTHPSSKEGGIALDAYIKEHGLKTVSFNDWKKIEQEEEKLATDPSPRAKIPHIKDMFKVIEQDKG